MGVNETNAKVYSTLSEEEKLAYEKEVKEYFNKIQIVTPLSELIYLINEMNAESKRYFLSKTLKSVPLNKALKLKVKQLILLIKSKIKNSKEQRQFIGVIFYILRDLYLEYHLDENDIRIIQDEIEIRNKYGDWHYYFALYFAPFTNEAIKARTQTLLDELLNHKTTSTSYIEAAQQPATELDDVRNKEKAILQQERMLRIELQEKNDKLIAQLKQVEQAHAAALKRQEEDAVVIETLNQKLNNAELQKKEIHLAFQEVSVSLQKTTKQMRQLSQENKKLLEKEISNSESPVISIPGPAALTAAREENIEEAYRVFYQSVRKQVSELMEGMLKQPDRIEVIANRKHLQEHMQMLTQLERYNQDTLHAAVNSIIVPSSTATIDQEQSNEEEINKEDPILQVQEQRLGYFFRYSHGGRIDFEDGTSINITERIVTSVGLEHQAVVECKEKEDGGYYISLILQGDDSLSNVDQFLGYIKFNNYNTPTCVDIHTEKVYNVHYKDMDYWKAEHGDTGLFNIENGSDIARISRMYKTNAEAATFSSSKSTVTSITSKRDKPNSSTKAPTPFLQGCKIVIVGGLEKWFEDTVRSTGAELIHNSGHHPQRVYGEIKNADALFLLLTANSHNATWGAIEAAKKHNIPHFKIAGSKSNLYALLWENQDKIKRNE